MLIEEYKPIKTVKGIQCTKMSDLYRGRVFLSYE